MSVRARRDPGGEEHLVVADASDTVEALLAAVHEALSLGEGVECWEVVHVDGDGEEHSLSDCDAGAELSEVGIIGAEEVVMVRAGAKIIARAELAKCYIDGEEAAWSKWQDLMSKGEADEERVAWFKLLAASGYVSRSRSGDGRTALHFVVRYSALLADEAVATIALLCDGGAAVDAGDDKGLTPLHVAALCGLTVFARVLIAHGASVDAQTLRGQTALHLAVEGQGQDAAALVELLCIHGASVEATDSQLFTPLHIAVVGCRPDLMRILLARGASVTAPRWHERPPLHFAAELGSVSAIGLLIEHGASVDATDEFGWTALHLLAAQGGSGSAADALILHGASVDSVGQDGLTPSRVAKSHGHDRLAKYLRRKETTDRGRKCPLQ